MAVLGTFIDKVAGNTLAGPTTTTYPHSLGVAADRVSVEIKSHAAATAYQLLIAQGGNASLNTIAVLAASTGATGTVFFDVWSYNYYNPAR